MRKIATLALMSFALVTLSQKPSMQVNGNALVIDTLGASYLTVQAIDPTAYSTVSAKSDSAIISIFSVGSNANIGTLYDNKTAYLSADADKTGIINERTTGQIVLATGGYGITHEAFRISKDGQIMIEANGPTHPLTPSAYLHISRGTSAAGHAPIKLSTSSSVILTTPEAGAIETDGTDLYWTNGSGVRKKIVLQ